MARQDRQESRPGHPISPPVRTLLEDAASIFDTARSASLDGQSQDLAILVNRYGHLRIVEAAGWNPDALRTHYGAQAVYQVTHTARTVRVQAQDHTGANCLLETPTPKSALPSRPPTYTLLNPPLLLR